MVGLCQQYKGWWIYLSRWDKGMGECRGIYRSGNWGRRMYYVLVVINIYSNQSYVIYQAR